jgi:aminoglycoside/choline kinase family phosphotransferase
MKPELSERLYIEELFNNSKKELSDDTLNLESIERLTGDASTRRYYRLFSEKISFVACLDNPTQEGANTFVNMQQFLSSYKIRVPKIYDKNPTKGYLLEEDLGDVTLLHHLASIENEQKEFEVYKSIIDSLLEMHKIEVNDEMKKKVSLSFDYDKLISEIEFTDKFFFKRFLKVEDEKQSRDLVNFFSPICKRLSQEKMVFTHRDFHSRNVMVKDNEFVIIDFQDARLGIPQYDLVSMLEDCYYELTENNKEKLIHYYFEQLDLDIHRQESIENFNSLYNDMLLQRVFKAVGSFAYIYETRKDVRYVKYIGFAMEKIRKTMLKDSKYDDLRKLLFEIYYES